VTCGCGKQEKYAKFLLEIITIVKKFTAPLYEAQGKGKGKGTVHPRTGHEGPEGE
jgi:hypothetical protein